ncbi:MAG TPA: Txe/YoeB family addiction module toxin [Longimicrobium sp.]|nr:Txe/YoeB family addiction module toxin [Longimicrobium sp.]
MKRKPSGGMPPTATTTAKREVILSDRFGEDLLFWSRSDPRRLTRILELVESIRRDPMRGIGKPELLKHDMAGCWSRRIDEEHRLVYQILPA